MMDYKDVIKKIKSGDLAPIYLLMGEEPYFIDLITKYIQENVLEESEKSFNQTIVYGKDTDPQEIIDAANRYPMMAEKQVVIVKEAQEIRGIADAFEKYAEKPVPTTILVIAHKYKKVDKRTKFYKNCDQNGITFNSEKVKEWKLADWIASEGKSKKLEFTPKAANLIAEFLGNDLSKIQNELDKLKVLFPEGIAVNDKIVEEHIGISKDYNMFELTNAIGERNLLKAQKIVDYFSKNPKNGPLVVIVSSLYNFYSQLMAAHYIQPKTEQAVARQLKMHPFVAKKTLASLRWYPKKKIAQNIQTLKEYDLKSKGVNSSGNVTDGELMKEMVFRLMH